MKKTVVLGITSGIAAYKTLDLIQALKHDGVEVFVVMTKASTQMVDTVEFANASGNKVYADLFEQDFNYKNILKERKVDHIDLADRADVICIAPATANIIAKLAHGIADDFLTTMVLAANSPIVLSPSMNVHMWTNPITQENIERLKKRKMIVLPPEKGPLACGYEGPGRLPQIEKIKEEVIRQLLYSKSLAGKKIIVTAGATKEKIDDVRFITNNSSGKMGAAIADECHLRGAEVLLMRATNSSDPRYVYAQEYFETAEELHSLIKKHTENADFFFHTAAVGDFAVLQKEGGKMSSKADVSIALTTQTKLSDEIKKINNSVKLIIFKAEWGLSGDQLIKRAREKLVSSHAEMVVANDLSKPDRGFHADTNEVIVVTKNTAEKISLRLKEQCAYEIVTRIGSL